MYAFITSTKIETTIFCATCSTSVQKARAKHADVGPIQGSWSLQSEHFLPLSSISFDILPRTLCPDDLTCVGHTSQQPFWFALIKALRYTLLTLPHNLCCARFTLGGSNCVGSAGKQRNGPRILHQKLERSFYDLHVHNAEMASDRTFTLRNWGFLRLCSMVRRQARGYSGRDRNSLDSVLACYFANHFALTRFWMQE